MSKQHKEQKMITVPVKWQIGNDVITRFATNLLVQTVGNVYKLSFFEAKPAIRLTEDTPLPTEVVADCVASLVVSPSQLKEIINVLEQHLKRSTGVPTESEPLS